jgi:hypothetical protein
MTPHPNTKAPLMCASPAQIAANIRNSKLSTGPRSTTGKQKSRSNALKHALTARVLRTPEEVAAIGEAIEIPPGPPGSSPFENDWLISEIKLLGLRIERAGRMEMTLRDREALRAGICWESDRRLEAEVIGAAIHRRPAQVAAQLEESPQGCRWKVNRWAMLARTADRDGNWDAAACSVAFDLLGTPHAFRHGAPGESIDVGGKILETGLDLAEFARRQVARLQELREDLAEVDAYDQSSVQAGVGADLGPEGRRLNRYEVDLHRRLRWYCELLGENPIAADLQSEIPAVVELPASIDRKEPVQDPAPIRKTTVTASLPIPSRHDRKAERVERRKEAAERKRARKLA